MKSFIVFSLFLFMGLSLSAQEKLTKFTLDDVLRIAKDQSPDAILARHRFRASYWQYRSYKANYLPSVNLSSTLPNFNRTISWDDASQKFVDINSLINTGEISLAQNIGLTGGALSLKSRLQQVKTLGAGSSTSYLSSPVSINYDQPLFAYNSMKWERKIQPMVYEEAKKVYLDGIEDVALRAISRYFDFALAQLNLRIAQMNYSNSDTLYKIARGRYNIGTIAENDVLQMQLAFLNAKTSLTQAEVDLELQKAKLRSFLGYNEKVDFELDLPVSIPAINLDYTKVLDLSMKNNPDVMARHRQLIEANRDVAQAKGQRRSVNLNISYGLGHSQTNDLPAAYKAPYYDNEKASMTISMPMIDWGRGRGRVKMAESNQELINVQVEQAQIDFEQNVFLQVMQFNLQKDQVMIAAKSDTIGQKRYDVTKQRFLIGKIDVLNLNDALKEKDSAKRGYISALRGYWNYFYTLRQLTLYDFVHDQVLEEDFDKLVQ
jgi:outer membrane protein